MKYTYFVAYTYWTKDGNHGYGNMEIFATKKLKTFKDLDTTVSIIKNDLEKNKNIEVKGDPILTNFILLNKKIVW